MPLFINQPLFYERYNDATLQNVTLFDERYNDATLQNVTLFDERYKNNHINFIILNKSIFSM